MDAPAPADTSNARRMLGLDRPTVATQGDAKPQSQIRAEQRERVEQRRDRVTGLLVKYVHETRQMLETVSSAKSNAATIDDWQRMMLLTSGYRDRVSALASNAAGLYDELYWYAYEEQFDGPGESGPSVKRAEARAKGKCAQALAVKTRLAADAKALGDMIWEFRGIAEGMRADQASTFSADPGNLVPDQPPSVEPDPAWENDPANHTDG